MLSAVQRAIETRPAGTRLVLLCDFDGTLAELCDDPAAPTLLPRRRALFQTLVTRPDLSLGLVSGRRIVDLRGRTGLPESVYHAGLHGLEIEVDDRRWQHPDLERHRQAVRALVQHLNAMAREVPGLFVEDKDISVAVHVRAVAPERRETVLARARRLAAPGLAAGELAVLGGSFVLEFLPNIAWNKGDATTWIAADVEARYGAAPWVVFIGDDITDEHAFAAIRRGIGVLVGQRPTAAAYRVPSPSDVERLLRELAFADKVREAS